MLYEVITMPKKIYIVDLTKKERAYLLDFIKSDEKSARKINRARILLLADEGKSDSEIAAALHTGTATVFRTVAPMVPQNHQPGRQGSGGIRNNFV